MRWLLFCFFFCFGVSAAELTGEVIKVYDGDTIRIRDEDGGRFKIRFADIDAPEKDQIFGDQAAGFLTGMILGKTVRIRFTEIDTYGRIVGTVHREKIHVNAALVQSGFAWWYREYSKNTEFAIWEEKARAAKLGIWKEENPVPPWQYRKEQKRKGEK